MTKVRECLPRDIPFLVDLAVEFNDSYYDVPLDLNKLRVYLRQCMESPDWVGLRSDTGAILGVFIQDPYRDWKVLVETAWFSKGIDGVKLLKEFEKYGELRGVNEIRMTTLESNPKVQVALRKLGYTVIETSHRKTVR